jgi:hypothetical protein
MKLLLPKLLLSVFVCLLSQVEPLCADDAPKVATSQEAASTDFRLQIQASHDTYFGGEPIVLTVTLTNISDHKRSVGFFVPKAEWLVKGEDGQEIGLTAQGTKKSVRRMFNAQGLEAGKSIVYKVLINRLFDMSAAGTYEIVGQRWPISETGKAGDVTGNKVTSNAIKISVTEEDGRAE